MWEFGIGVRASQDPEELNKHPPSIEHRQMAVLERLKEKFPTFWGIETPTLFQKQVSRGT